MDEIEETAPRKELLPGQYRLDDALAKAMESLVEDAIRAMREQERDYDAWYRRQRWDGTW